jgi:hypothetical protein
MVKRGTVGTGTLDINYDWQGNTSPVSDLARQVKAFRREHDIHVVKA